MTTKALTFKTLTSETKAEILKNRSRVHSRLISRSLGQQDWISWYHLDTWGSGGRDNVTILGELFTTSEVRGFRFPSLPFLVCTAFACTVCMDVPRHRCRIARQS